MRSDVQVARELRVLLDELETQLRLAAHQALDQVRGVARFLALFLDIAVRHAHAQQHAVLRVHGGLLEIVRLHLAQALEAAYLDLDAAGELGLQQLLLVGVVARIDLLGALGQRIERRLCQEQVAVLDQVRHLAEEEGHQERGDVGAVDIGVGHDDDLVVAQALLVVVVARAAAKRLDQVDELLVAGKLIGGGAGDVEDLAAQRQHGLGLAVARRLGGTAGGITLHQEDLGAGLGILAAVGELAGQAQLARRGLARQLLVLALAQALLRALDHPVQQVLAAGGIVGQPVIEMILDGGLDQTGRFGACQLFLGLALELRIADEQRQDHHGAADQVFRRDLPGLAVADQLAIGAQRAAETGAQSLLVGAALGRRDRIAVEAAQAFLFIGFDRPGYRPLDPALLVGKLRLPDEGGGGDGLLAVHAGGQVVAEAAREVQGLLGGSRILVADQRPVARPADLVPAVEVGLGPAHAIEAFGAEVRLLAEYLRIGVEADRRAAPVDVAGVLQFSLRLTLAIGLNIKLFTARNLDQEIVAERVYDRHANAVQPAGGFIDLPAKLAA